MGPPSSTEKHAPLLRTSCIQIFVAADELNPRVLPVEFVHIADTVAGDCRHQGHEHHDKTASGLSQTICATAPPMYWQSLARTGDKRNFVPTRHLALPYCSPYCPPYLLTLLLSYLLEGINQGEERRGEKAIVRR